MALRFSGRLKVMNPMPSSVLTSRVSYGVMISWASSDGRRTLKRSPAAPSLDAVIGHGRAKLSNGAGSLWLDVYSGQHPVPILPLRAHELGDRLRRAGAAAGHAEREEPLHDFRFLVDPVDLAVEALHDVRGRRGGRNQNSYADDVDVVAQRLRDRRNLRPR